MEATNLAGHLVFDKDVKVGDYGFRVCYYEHRERGNFQYREHDIAIVLKTDTPWGITVRNVTLRSGERITVTPGRVRNDQLPDGLDRTAQAYFAAFVGLAKRHPRALLDEAAHAVRIERNALAQSLGWELPSQVEDREKDLSDLLAERNHALKASHEERINAIFSSYSA